MSFQELVRSVDASTARAFVTAARHVIDALLIEVDRIRQVQTPAPRDYGAAQLSREAPGGGWVSEEELRATSQRIAEAIAAEKWIEGLAAALRILALIGGNP